MLGGANAFFFFFFLNEPDNKVDSWRQAKTQFVHMLLI